MAGIEEIRNLAAPLRQDQFRVIITNPPGEGAGIELMQFRCTATSIPNNTLGEVVTNLDGHNVSDAAPIEGPREWTCTFSEGTDVQIMTRMNSWQKLIYDPATGIMANRADYKRNVVIEVYGNDKAVVLSKTLIGAWPKAVPEIAFDKSSKTEAVTFDITFAFDYMD